MCALQETATRSHQNGKILLFYDTRAQEHEERSLHRILQKNTHLLEYEGLSHVDKDVTNKDSHVLPTKAIGTMRPNSRVSSIPLFHATGNAITHSDASVQLCVISRKIICN